MTPAQQATLQRRYDTAITLERTTQILREAQRYGLDTVQHRDAVTAAGRAWDIQQALTRGTGA